MWWCLVSIQNAASARLCPELCCVPPEVCRLFWATRRATAGTVNDADEQGSCGGVVHLGKGSWPILACAYKYTSVVLVDCDGIQDFSGIDVSCRSSPPTDITIESRRPMFCRWQMGTNRDPATCSTHVFPPTISRQHFCRQVPSPKSQVPSPKSPHSSSSRRVWRGKKNRLGMAILSPTHA